MTRLTQVAITTRKIIRYSTYFIIFLIVGRMILGLAVGIVNKVFPKGPPPPTVAFKKLPKLVFPDKQNLPKFTFKVETATGDLPILPTQAKVYFMPKTAASLSSLDVAKQKAASLGFNTEPTAASSTVYRFAQRNVPSTLEMNIVTGVFSISYDLSADPTPLAQLPPTPEFAETQVKNFLTSGGVLPDDLSGGGTSHDFLKVQGRQLVSAISLSEANLIKVSLFRKAYDTFPSMTNDPTVGNVWFYVSGAPEREKQIIGGEYHYFPVDENQLATYPLKTAKVAFDELTGGKGYIASLGLNTDGNVTIRKIYLGYYDSGQPQQFYQPIVVFEGDRGFVGYVPAIITDWFQD